MFRVQGLTCRFPTFAAFGTVLLYKKHHKRPVQPPSAFEENEQRFDHPNWIASHFLRVHI